MIRPSKYLDLSTSVLRLAAIILETLQDDPNVRIDDLRARVESEVGDRSRHNFFPALNFLYLTGRLDYDDTRDAVVSQLPNVRDAA